VAVSAKSRISHEAATNYSLGEALGRKDNRRSALKARFNDGTAIIWKRHVRVGLRRCCAPSALGRYLVRFLGLRPRGYNEPPLRGSMRRHADTQTHRYVLLYATRSPGITVSLRYRRSTLLNTLNASELTSLRQTKLRRSTAFRDVKLR
jgi:hypothetical protein